MNDIEKTIGRIETLLVMSLRKLQEIKKMVTNPEVLKQQLKHLRDSYFKELYEILDHL